MATNRRRALDVQAPAAPDVRRALRSVPRRILLVSPQPFFEDRGTPIAVLQVAQALSQAGYAVDLLSYPVGRDVELPGMRILRAPNPLRIRRVPVGLSLRKLLLDATLVPMLFWTVSRERYLCIQAVEEAAFPAAWIGRLRGVPVVYDMQSSMAEQLARHPLLRAGPLQAFFRRCERWLLRRADFVVGSVGLGDHVQAVAPAARWREWRFADPPGPRATGEQLNLRRKLGIPAGAPVVLYGGNFHPYQGVDRLLDAADRVLAARPDAVFVLVGADRPEIRRDGAIRLLERLPRPEMASFLGMADVLVSPRAFGNNLPLKVFDYLAAGKPIVATDTPSHRAVLCDDRAVLVPPDAAGLAAGILRLLNDTTEARRLAEAARAYDAAELGWIRFARSVTDLYDEVCAPPPRRMAS
ncbi:MAG TPA: glycosyltransferase [Candidatus Polarisedimenticolaceae bacterium]|nr:glycosyltransferase [Candidatus Polarisedimenticolaceae bacterium]